MELLIFLFFLFIFLVLVTVVGHLMWLMWAALFRWIWRGIVSLRTVTTDKTDETDWVEKAVEEVVVEPVIKQSVPSVPSVVVEPEPEQPPRPPRPPRRPFSEVLNSFMEESNIRWGEIIGGLLIVGCSTALVVSLWAQISEIPVLKFLIFTTVTAVLFGIGLYTEHRWKLPTTSRGVLTIATLLVPLNFLAIAAVSAGNTPGALAMASELVAPAIFFCLVYFAGRVITPGCAHVLSAGVLGSSIGQLLVRHFATSDLSPSLLVFLAAFPVGCYVVTVALALRLALEDREIDGKETSTIFTILGAMSFAALLPFGLLLYKAGPLPMTMMYLAPVVTLWGLPLLATGTVLWRRIKNKDLVASRTTGTALGIIGVFIVLLGMILAWPNPASIVPAALLNFVIFTALALALELPVAHLIAAACLTLAYLVLFQVSAGRVAWVNLRATSLLKMTLSLSSGQALAGMFAILLIASEWLSRKKRVVDSYYYLVAACAVAAVSLAVTAVFGFGITENHWLWIVFVVYSLGAFWIAWRQKQSLFTWIASAMLLFSFADGFSRTVGTSFPWQTALLAHATLCAALAIGKRRFFSKELNHTALLTLVLGVVALFQANTWQVTAFQAQRVFWIASILLLLLWLNRRRLIFNAFQIALICAVTLTVKAALQQFDWYSYLPHAFLHPSALQIYGTVLTLLCLVWIGLRLLVKRALPKDDDGSQGVWLRDASRLLDTDYAVDRLLAWSLLGAFVVFAVYGALSGLTRELEVLGSDWSGVNIAGFPHQQVLALGSWILLGLLTVLWLANFWERRRQEYLLAAIVALSAALSLLAGRFEAQMATATAWRWLGALFLFGGSIVLWYRRNESRAIRLLLIVITTAPLLLFTAIPTLHALANLPVQAHTSGLFSWFSDDVSYGGPLLIIAGVMIGYALRQRLPAYGFCGGLFINATVTFCFLLAAGHAAGSMDRVVLVRLVQLNILAIAVYAIAWLSTRRLWLGKLDQNRRTLADTLLEVQIGFAIAFEILLIAPLTLQLVLEPAPIASAVIVGGSLLGWLALAATLAATTWLAKIQNRIFSASLWAGGLMALTCMTSFSVAGTSGRLAFHVLTVGSTISAWLMLLASDRYERLRRDSRRFAAGIGAFATFLSLLSPMVAEGSGWWSVGPLLALSALMAALNWRTFRRRYIYAAGILFNLAVIVACFRVLPWIFSAQIFFVVNMIAGSLAGIGLLWLELRSRRLRASETPSYTFLSFHHLAAIGWPILLTFFVVVSFEIRRIQSPVANFPLLHWLALASMIALMTAVLWDKDAKYAVAGLYLLGLLAIAMGLYQLDLSNDRLGWSTAILLGLYAVGTTVIWHWRERFITFAENYGIPRRLAPNASELPWFAAFTIVAVATIVLLAFGIDLRLFSFGLRFAAALAVIAQFVTFALLAEGIWRPRWQRAAIAVLVIGLMLLGWSTVTPHLYASWLNRGVILMLLAFSLVGLYGLLLDKANAYLPNWIVAIRNCLPWLLGAGMFALFYCLGIEVIYQLNDGELRIPLLSLIAIGITLIAAVVIPVLFALSPQHDPLSLSERGRMNYVYAAEVMLALLFLHVRLTLPWLFTGFIERYWPLAVMMIAYLGVVTSESLRRRSLLVLAQPLERTGVFLPLLPVLGFWLASSDVDFSLLMFVVGGLYGLLSVLRRSFVFGLLAALAGNGGLWYILHRTDSYQFLQHPQLWLIPVALSALLAAYLNEENLSDDQMAGIRYLSLVTIYVSSTADIFISGVANSPWLPLVLGSFSLAGVFAGIIFRIRGLLLLGTVFLLLSVVTMIWYASANFGWTWLWYVAGIVTGATIIFMFAVFEKKRSEVLRLVEGLKEWER